MPVDSAARLQSGITGPAPVPPHHGSPSARNPGSRMRQCIRQRGIGYQERPQAISPNDGSIRSTLMQKPRQIGEAKAKLKRMQNRVEAK